jgi:RNA polymerase sigma-70 factor, ECF subfamily
LTEKEQSEIFLDWINKHKGLVFKIVNAYAYNEMDRDDLFQDVALQIWKSIPSFRNQSAATTWIYRVSLNTSIGWLRREKKRGYTERIDLADHILVEEDNVMDERIAWLYRQIHQLDSIDRSLALLLMEELSYEEMASILGISEANVAVKIHRIKKYLISKLKTYGV